MYSKQQEQVGEQKTLPDGIYEEEDTCALITTFPFIYEKSAAYELHNECTACTKRIRKPLWNVYTIKHIKQRRLICLREREE